MSKTTVGTAGKVLIGILTFIVLTALAVVVPASIPGELSPSEMTHHVASACQACPPTEQITDAGMIAVDSSWYVNVRFAAPPLNTLVRMSFEGVAGDVEAQQTGTTWHSAPIQTGGAALTSVSQRGNQVVFAIPASLRTNGIAVTTGSGDRLPASDFIKPSYPAAAHFNATDVLILLALILTAWYGFRRGFLIETENLIAMAVSLALAVLGAKPLYPLFLKVTHDSRAAASLASAVIVVGIGLVSMSVFPRLFARVRKRPRQLSPSLDGAFGSVAASIRQLAVMAMLLTVGTDLMVTSWASRNINSSILGSALSHAWRSLF